MARTKVLFLCDQNRLRSKTAQALYEDDPRLEVRSAGVRSGAEVVVTRELLEWADLIFVMERSQRNVVHKRFRDLYDRKPIVCLYIADEYDFLDPVLVQLLSERVPPHLPS
jgi:predicted protein tyrosine phosphatase